MTDLARGRRGRFLTMATVLGMLAALLVTLPTVNAEADGPVTVETDAGVILLSTGPNDNDNWIRYYEDPQVPGSGESFDGVNPTPTAHQVIDVSRKCNVTTNGLVLTISNSGGTRGTGIGMVSNGLGTRTKNNCSTQQGRINASHSLTFALGAYFDTTPDISIDLFEVDIEGKFGADLFWTTDASETGTVDLENSSDNGPDSGVGDNDIAVADPNDPFRSITFSPSGGEVAIEGGGDGAITGGAERTAFEVNQTLLKLVSSKTFDGEITCQDSVEIKDGAVPGVLGLVTMHAMNFDSSGWSVELCPKKPYDDELTANSLHFLPELVGTFARYTIQITLDDQPVASDGLGLITTLGMTYDAAGGTPTTPLQACQAQPLSTDAFWTQPAPVQNGGVNLLPTGETACYYGLTLTPTGVGSATEVWDIYFEDDPGFSWR